MTKFIAIFCAFFSICMATVYANSNADKTIQLAEQGVQGKDANGDPQTTVVDANGNLKMVPVDKDGKPLPPDKVKNATPDQNDQVQ